MTLDDSSIAILGGEVPTSDGIAISAEMKTYNIDNGDWTSQPGKKRPAGTNLGYLFHSLQMWVLFEVCRVRECQICMQIPQLCAKPRHFCKINVATSRMAFLNLNLHVLQVAASNSNN